MRALPWLTAFAAGCHLIGGAGDLEFRDTTGQGGGGAQGGSDGGGGASCEASCTDVCSACDVPGMEGMCAPLALGSGCDEGVCDGSGMCATGAPRWARVFGDDLDSLAADIDVRGDDVVIVGSYDADGPPGFALDDKTIDTADNAVDLLIAKLDRGSGNALWAVSAGTNPDPQRLSAVAIDPTGDIVVAGAFQGSINHSGWSTVSANFSSPNYKDTVFVGKLAPDGQGLWSYSLTRAENATTVQKVDDVAVGPDGTIAVAGHFSGSLYLLGDDLYSPCGADNGMIILLEPDEGAPQIGEERGGYWVASCDYSEVTAVTFDETGALWAVGPYEDSTSFSDLLPDTDLSALIGFAIRIDPATGDTVDLRTLGTDADDEVMPTAVAATSGGIVVAGTFNGSLDMGGGFLANASGDPDVFVTGIALDGATQWLTTVVADGAPSVTDVAVDSAGFIAVSGTITVFLDFGDGHLVHADGSPQAFVFKLDPAGNFVWANGYGSTGSDAGAGLAVDADRALYLAGTAGGLVPPSEDGHGGLSDILVMGLAP